MTLAVVAFSLGTLAGSALTLTGSSPRTVPAAESGGTTTTVAAPGTTTTTQAPGTTTTTTEPRDTTTTATDTHETTTTSEPHETTTVPQGSAEQLALPFLCRPPWNTTAQGPKFTNGHIVGHNPTGHGRQPQCRWGR